MQLPWASVSTLEGATWVVFIALQRAWRSLALALLWEGASPSLTKCDLALEESKAGAEATLHITKAPPAVCGRLRLRLSTRVQVRGLKAMHATHVIRTSFFQHHIKK